MFGQRNEIDSQMSFETTSMRQYVIRTFLTMGLGLLVTSIVSFVLYTTGLGVELFYSNRYMPLLLLVVQFGTVFAFVSRIRKMSSGGAKSCFLLYAVITGVVFSTLGAVYSAEAIVAAFLVTTVYFACLVTIGYATKMDLLRFGPLLMGALITFVIAQFVMFLMGMSIETKLISVIGLLIFTGITAYDAQKMKRLYAQNIGNEQMISTLSIYSAFELYLDFINMFLYILRLLGNRD